MFPFGKALRFNSGASPIPILSLDSNHGKACQIQNHPRSIYSTKLYWHNLLAGQHRWNTETAHWHNQLRGQQRWNSIKQSYHLWKNLKFNNACWNSLRWTCTKIADKFCCCKHPGARGGRWWKAIRETHIRRFCSLLICYCKYVGTVHSIRAGLALLRAI